MCPTRVEIFTFTNLPEKHDENGGTLLDPGLFELVEPVAVGEDADGQGHMRQIPDEPLVARYIAVRYEPFFKPVFQAGLTLPSWRQVASASLGPVGVALEQIPRMRGRQMVLWLPASVTTSSAVTNASPVFEATIEIADADNHVISRSGRVVSAPVAPSLSIPPSPPQARQADPQALKRAAAAADITTP